MAFEGPASIDYRNVSALNRAYLSLLQADRRARDSLVSLAPALVRRITSLTPAQIERLAATPFLLLSFREQDDKLWGGIFADDGERDLFASSLAEEHDRLRSAGLGFVWQLARQNPYTLRLICGASLHWCEQLAERTVFDLLAAAAPHTDLLQLRRAGDAELWRKLLDAGVRRERDVRTAAHISALQAILTRPPDTALRPWAVAACRSRASGMRVADE